MLLVSPLLEINELTSQFLLNKRKYGKYPSIQIPINMSKHIVKKLTSKLHEK